MRGEPEPLSGGNMGSVVRLGDTVVRESGEWTPAVHRLLTHLDSAGVRGAPQPRGFAEDGREVVSFVEGVVPSYPMPGWVWSKTALDSAARLLRQVHDATAGHDLEGPWRTEVHYPVEVICHNDFAPYNLVFEGSEVVGVIDWDFASPGPRLWDLAYLAYRMVPLTTADWADGFGPDSRHDRLARLLRKYGTDAQPREVIDVVVQRLHDLAQFSDRAAVTLNNTDLSDHATLYRRDAAHLTAAR
jgi:aminoglycoside phosphotransferase (APT) family kinase protein